MIGKNEIVVLGWVIQFFILKQTKKKKIEFVFGFLHPGGSRAKCVIENQILWTYQERKKNN